MTRHSQRSPSIVVATANLGRASLTAFVVASMERIRDTLLGLRLPIVLFLQEIDEGDRTKPSDHTLLRRIFRWRKGWRKAHMRGRDPILTHGVRRRKGRSLRAAAGLARQTPARRLEEQLIRTPGDQPDIACIGGHYPAGAYNGDRAPETRKALRERWNAMHQLHRERIDHHLKLGRHVVTGIDANHRSFPRLEPKQVELHRRGPDYLIAIPADGWRVVRGDAGSIQLDIERLHDCLHRTIYFEEIR